MTLDEFDEALLERVTDMTAITEIRFEELAAAYGASVARWPAVAQPSVQALLETSPEARCPTARCSSWHPRRRCSSPTRPTAKPYETTPRR